jgi:hypothetical protein
MGRVVGQLATRLGPCSDSRRIPNRERFPAHLCNMEHWDEAEEKVLRFRKVAVSHA